MKVLIAEDDPITRNGLIEILQSEGYEVMAAANGEETIELFSRVQPDFICLDIMMPGKDGYSVCRQIRSMNSQIPIVFISAKSEEIDKVVGLELGADDFIVKPFGVREVIARIRAITRRCINSKKSADFDSESVFDFGDLKIYPNELRAKRNTVTIDLSLREIRLLALFAKNPRKALTRQQISEACWDAEHFPTSRTLDQHISQLRKHIEVDPHDPRLIQTVHGVGYRHDS
ncbi:MAG: response regulator transcription factor [Candidatus Riflebacteria bacterium]|nr:response regulator transcription factor [Candidatus Riflebacteria bacterium]